MMLLNSCSDRESEQLCGIGAEAGRPVVNSKPSEVVGEVFRGNTLETDHPCAQARTKGIDVLHMPPALHAHAPFKRLMIRLRPRLNSPTWRRHVLN